MSNGRGINRSAARLDSELELDPTPDFAANLAEMPHSEVGSASWTQQTRSASVQRLLAYFDAHPIPPWQDASLGLFHRRPQNAMPPMSIQQLSQWSQMPISSG